MRFLVPQFVDVEDKIFGPLTLKQFIYLGGGAGICIVLYLFLPLYISVMLIALAGGFSAAMAFYKVNNKPFIFFLESATKYLFHSKLYIWRKEQALAEEAKKDEDDANPSAFIPKLSNSKLKDLTWSLDTREALNPTTNGDKTI